MQKGMTTMELLRLVAFAGVLFIIVLIGLPYLFTKYHSGQILTAVYDRAQEVRRNPSLKTQQAQNTITAFSLSKKVGQWFLEQNPAGNGFSIQVRPVSQMICNYIVASPLKADSLHVNGVPYKKGTETCTKSDENVMVFFFDVTGSSNRRR